MGDKELTPVGAGAAVGHREGTGPAVPQAGMELVGEAVPWTARSVSLGVTALNHEVLEDPVKGQSVIEPFAGSCLRLDGTFGQTHEVRDR